MISWSWLIVAASGIVFTAVFTVELMKAFDALLDWMDERRQVRQARIITDPTEWLACGVKTGWRCVRCGQTSWGAEYSTDKFCVTCSDWTPGEVVTWAGSR